LMPPAAGMPKGLVSDDTAVAGAGEMGKPAKAVISSVTPKVALPATGGTTEPETWPIALDMVAGVALVLEDTGVACFFLWRSRFHCDEAL